MAHTSKQGKRKRSRALTSGEQQRQLRKANKLVDALDVIQQDFLKLGVWRIRVSKIDALDVI